MVHLHDNISLNYNNSDQLCQCSLMMLKQLNFNEIINYLIQIT